MKNFLSILGIIAILIFAFSYTGNNVMSTKPVAPAQTVVLHVDHWEAQSRIIYWAKKGFVVTNSAVNYNYITITMVKY